jgi:hypothetical protein
MGWGALTHQKDVAVALGVIGERHAPLAGGAAFTGGLTLRRSPSQIPRPSSCMPHKKL